MSSFRQNATAAEHDDDLEGRGAAYVSTFRWGRGRTAISPTAGIDYVSTFHGEGV
jgi:hypothetical protein